MYSYCFSIRNGKLRKNIEQVDLSSKCLTNKENEGLSRNLKFFFKHLTDILPSSEHRLCQLVEHQSFPQLLIVSINQMYSKWSHS